MRIEDITGMIRFKRKVHGIAAALLPFDENGEVAVDAFKAHLVETCSVGLINAVNMDTGYINLLNDSDQLNVLKWTREALGPGVTFVAGAFIEGLEGEVVSLYRRKLDQIVSFGAMPILFQTTRLHHADWRQKVSVYNAICRDYESVLGFELSEVFAPNGEIFDENTFRGLLEIPELVGLKHSSLDRLKEIERLQLRDELRPDFKIYTGNDLAINMIEYGSDYLLGLATFAPERFAERDRLWEMGDAAYFSLSADLQHLGNVAFRSPVPAYKHSGAHFLYLTGRVPTANTHPASVQRPQWESTLMAQCALRLGLIDSDNLEDNL